MTTEKQPDAQPVKLTDAELDDIARTAFTSGWNSAGEWAGVQPWVTTAFRAIEVAAHAKQRSLS